MQKFTKLFQPVTVLTKEGNKTHKDFLSNSYRLMLELGIIHQAIPGCFHILPLGLKSLNKIINIVDEEMQNLGAQKMVFPTLVKANIWEKTGRLQEMESELLTLHDRHREKFILGPTHEETVSNFISTLAPLSYKNYPSLLYQITTKFRDEIKPRFGLIRAREFLMKDLYSFDTTEETALKTYEKVCQSYDNIFKKIGVPFVKVLGSSGSMGGNLSHEYQFPAKIGDDKILICNKCNFTTNLELANDKECPRCKEVEDITIKNAIEVGHTFYLGTKYTQPLNAKYFNENGKLNDLKMCSFGIGISRILAAALECLSLEQELRWPDIIAPYNVVIIPPKKGSKEEALAENLSAKLYENLENSFTNLKNNIIIDDRTHLTIGRRFLDCKRTGIRFIIVLNKLSCCTNEDPVYEFNDIVKNERVNLSLDGIIAYLNGDNYYYDDGVYYNNKQINEI